MKVLRVRHHDASVHVSFSLIRFITDWPAAQQRFIDGMAEGLHDWHPVSPQNFSVTPAFALEDLRCKCQLFGGLCNVVLAPDTLQLDFSNVQRRSEPVVLETVRRSLEWLTSALDDRGRAGFSFDTKAHLQAMDDGAVDVYLGQFLPGDADAMGQLDPGVKCRPSTCVGFSDEEKGWVLRRVVEESRLIENGVFVDTSIHIREPAPASFGTQAELLSRLDRLADQFTGLQNEDS